MHLITAAVLTALLGRKPSVGRHGLPSFPGVLETAHALPGRLRLIAPSLVGRRKAAEQLEKTLGRLAGVRAVEVSSVSGSLIVAFAPDRLKPDLLFAAVIRLLGLERDIERAPPSAIGKGIHDAGQSLNHAVYQQTGGMIDLWTSVTLLLAVAGARQVLAGNPLGWPLLWWAYRSAFPGQGSGE